MIWNQNPNKIFNGVKQFNREISSLEELSRQADPLRPEELGRIKQAVLLEIAKQPKALASPLSIKEKTIKLLRVIIPTLLGLSLVGGTAFASTAAKPGDLLYPVKIATEKVRLNLTFSQSSKASLQAEFAGERLKELKEISRQPGQSQNHQPILFATSSGNLDVSASTTADSGQVVRAKIEADREVRDALQALRHAKTQSQSHGDIRSVGELDKKISNLEQQAVEQNIVVSLPISNEDSFISGGGQTATSTPDHRDRSGGWNLNIELPNQSGRKSTSSTPSDEHNNTQGFSGGNSFPDKKFDLPLVEPNN